MATVYSMTDTDAPQSPANSTSSYYGNIYFRSILMACLVDGYTGKSAAGWTVVYDDADVSSEIRFALANANGDVIEFVAVGTYGFAIFLWDSITTPGTGLTMSTGSGKAKIYNYTDPDLSPDNCAGIKTYYLSQYCNASYSSASSWAIIADEYTFAFLPIYDAFNSNSNSKSNTLPFMYCGAVITPWKSLSDAGNFHLYASMSNISSILSGPITNTLPSVSDYKNFSAIETPGGSPYNASTHEYYLNYLTFAQTINSSNFYTSQSNLFSYYPITAAFLTFSGTESNCPGYYGETVQSNGYCEFYGKFRFIFTAGAAGGGDIETWLFNKFAHTQWADAMDIKNDGYEWFWERINSSYSTMFFGITNHPDFN